MAESLTLEQSFEELDKIIKELEKGELSINDSLKKYKDGIELVNNCNQQLDKVKKEMIMIMDKKEEADGI